MSPTSITSSLGLALLASLTMLPVPTRAQDLPAEVRAVLAHRIGHWEGHNEVLGPDGKVIRTEEEIHDAQFVINGAIVEIRGRIEGREDFRAFLLYDPTARQFSYSTVDRSNHHGDMTAEASAPYRFTSRPRTLPDGRTMTFRLVFDTVEPDRMSGYGEVSLDGGATWRKVYNQVLRRVAGP